MNAKSVLQKCLFVMLCLLTCAGVVAAPASGAKVAKSARDAAIGKQARWGRRGDGAHEGAGELDGFAHW